jgi:hypothetical protein
MSQNFEKATEMGPLKCLKRYQTLTAFPTEARTRKPITMKDNCPIYDVGSILEEINGADIV